MGHWIPKSVVDDDEGSSEHFREFKSAMFDKLDSKMEGICQVIMQDYKLLGQDRIIEATDAEPTQAFQEKTEALRNDDVQLYRIWSGRHFFDLPYDLGEVEAISDIFDDLVDTARRSKKKNVTKRAVMEAVRDWSLKPLSSL